MQKIILRLKAYDESYLKKAFSEISKIFFFINVCVTRTVYKQSLFLPLTCPPKAGQRSHDADLLSYDFLPSQQRGKQIANSAHKKNGNLHTNDQLYFYDCKVFSYPKTRKLYTIIRSPHIHKKSKEQFEFVCKKKKIIIKVKDLSFVSLFFFLLKNCQIPGVEVDFSVEYGTYLNI